MPLLTEDHELRRLAILDAIKNAARPFADTSAEARERRRSLPFFDWAQTYLPHYFSSAPWSAHVEAERASREEGMPQYHCWSRGAGKSTIFSLAKPLRWELNTALRKAYDEPGRHFIIMAGATEGVAVAKADYIKWELEANPRIRADYGEEACQVEGTEGDRIYGSTRIWCRGIGQSPRGQFFRGHRPDAFIGDDLENEILVKNPDREQELWDWINGAVLGGLEVNGCIFINLGNMYGRHCLMHRAAQQAQKTDDDGRPLCRYFVYALRDRVTKQSLWPERYPTDKLARRCALLGMRNARREIDCLPDDETAAFKPEWIHEFRVADVDPSDFRKVAVLDPAGTSQTKNDYSALPTLGVRESEVNTKRPNIYCLNAWIRHATPNQVVRATKRINDDLGPFPFWCERNVFNEWGKAAFEAVPGAPDVRTFHQTGNKDDRIIGLQSDFEAGRFYFDPSDSDQQLLIDQFLDYGMTGVHDDGPDAFEDAVRRLDKRGAGALVPLPDVM